MLMLRFLAACVVVTTATLTASAQTPQRAGCTEIQVMPSSFLVRAKDPDGNPVMMVINPDSITAVTESGAAGTGSVPDQGRMPNTGSTTGSAAPNGTPSQMGR